MAQCPDTGLDLPECSCRTCTEALIATHAPGLLEAERAACDADATAATQLLAHESRRRPIVAAA